MKKFLLSLILSLPLLATAQSFEFNNSADGWSENNATLTTNATSLTLSFEVGQNAQLGISTAGVNASTSSIMAIRLRNTSQVSSLKIRSERLETTGTRFTNYNIEPFNLAYATYFFDLSNSEWDNNGDPAAVQNDINIIFRGPGDNVISQDGNVEIDRIAFISQAQKEDFTFEVDGNVEGWNGQAGSSIQAINGALQWTVDGTTNLARLAQDVFTVDATNQYAHILLQNNTGYGTLRFRYNSTTNVDFNMTTGGTTGYNSYQVITVDLTSNMDWTGLISDLQFQARNFTGTGAPTGTIVIERILFNNESVFDQPIIYSAGQFDPTSTITAANDLIVKDALTLTEDLDVNNLTVQNNGSLDAGNKVLNIAGDIIIDGTADFSTASLNLAGSTAQFFKAPDVTIDNLIMNNAQGVLLNANLNLTGILTLTNGALTTQPSTTPTGVLTFKSSNGKSAVVDQVVSGSVNGEVIVEKFFPSSTGSKFRFVSAPVNFTSSINDNWQQSGLNPGDANFQPNVGTQITGGTIADGYDQSTSNNPSLFSYDNSYTTAADAFTALTSTNGNDLTAISPQAGDAYRIFIRGDRTVNLSSNMRTVENTRLISRGTLVTGEYPAAPAPAIALAGPGRFALVGNPYQSKVSVETLLQDPATTNVVRTEFWQYDPTIPQYVLYTFASGGSTTPAGSTVTGDILPGQSFFITSDAVTGNGSLRFQESYKSSGTDVATKNANVIDQLSINLFTQKRLASGRADDIAVVQFDDQFDPIFNTDDTAKFFGSSNSLAWENNGDFYIVNRTDSPKEGDIFNLNVFVGESADYGFAFDVPNLNDINAYFYDKLDDSYIALPSSDSTLINKYIDLSDTASGATNRFQVVFSKSTLSVDDNSAFAKALSLYPNPSNGTNISINGLMDQGPVDIALINLTGQEIYRTQLQSTNGTVSNIGLPDVTSGVYFITVSQNDRQSSLKLIIQ